jgi:hypothetical protein
VLSFILENSDPMKFYFDESGDFTVPTNEQQHAVGIVVGVVVPESVEEDFFDRFTEFVSELPQSAFKNGEPKGNLLNNEDRRSFAMIVSECEGVVFCPTMLDLTSMAGHGSKIHDHIVRKIQTIVPQCEFQTLRDEVEQLGRQIANLNPVQAFRLGTWAKCIKRSIADSILLHSHPEFNDCWDVISFEIDPVQRKAGSREEIVFKCMLPAWITGWNQQDPLTATKEIHTDSHPFVRNWGGQRDRPR